MLKKDRDENNLYRKFVEKRLPLADQLAAARSILANERTFLSYQRTSLTLFLSGVTFIKFFDVVYLRILGWIFLPSAVATFFLGVYRYVKMRDLIRNIEKETKENGEKRDKKERPCS